MPFYESMMILRGSMHVSDLMPSIKRASRKLVESGGIIRTIDNLGVRPLPHRIVKEREYERFGVYLRFRTSCTPEEVKEFEVVSRTDPKVLRVMTRTITERGMLCVLSPSPVLTFL